AINSLAWYQCDQLGTPQELTDEQSEIAWGAEYRAWGAVKEVIRKASDGRVELRNPIRFQGQYHDHETGLHYNRYRYYDPEVGRFVSKDPMGLAAGINPHVYAPSPVRWAAPLGLDYGIGIDPAAAGGNGHATLYFQNERGAWFSFNQGAAGETSSGGNIGFLTGSNAPAGVSSKPLQCRRMGRLCTKPQQIKTGQLPCAPMGQWMLTILVNANTIFIEIIAKTRWLMCWAVPA
uniref:RHS repeat domain-containing protein n=1 Tax=Burkholderia cepacia TaxID=292 RepID=UPI002ABE873B